MVGCLSGYRARPGEGRARICFRIITGPLTVNLQAERGNKGGGRIYTILLQLSDGSQNIATVRAPHDQDDHDHAKGEKEKGDHWPHQSRTAMQNKFRSPRISNRPPLIAGEAKTFSPRLFWAISSNFKPGRTTRVIPSSLMK